MKMKSNVKLGNADRKIGDRVNIAICERIYDRDGHPLSDGIVGSVDAVILSIGAIGATRHMETAADIMRLRQWGRFPPPARWARQSFLGFSSPLTRGKINNQNERIKMKTNNWMAVDWAYGWHSTAAREARRIRAR